MISTWLHLVNQFSSSIFHARCQVRITSSKSQASQQKDYSPAGWPGFLTPRALRNCLVILAALLLSTTPTSAKILKTKKQGLQTLVVGSGLEYQIDSEQSEYGYPLLLEYGFANNLTLTVEPSFVYIHKKVGTNVIGFGELETSLTYDFLAVRRYRPGLSAEGIIKWPTASHAELGTSKTDYSLGIIASMEFVHADMDFNALYTFVGSPPGAHLRNTVEVSLAAEWRLNPIFDLEGELAAVSGSGSGFRGRSGAIGGIGRGTSIISPEQRENEFSATIGVVEHINENFKLEEGVDIQLDGSWQVVFAWEWDFGGED